MSLFAPFYDLSPEHNGLRRKIWTYLAIAVFSLLLHLAIRLFSAESAAYLAISSILVGTIIAFALLVVLATSKTADAALRKYLAAWHAPLVFGLLAIGLWLASREERDLLYIHASMLYLPFAVLLYSQAFYVRDSRARIVLLMTVLIFLFATAVRILGLSYYPRYQTIDEPWVFSFVIHLIRTGTFGDALYYGRTVDVPYALLPMSYWLQTFAPSFWITRLYQFILFIPFVGFLGLAAYHLYGKRVAFFTLLAAFGSSTLYWSTHIRHDLPFLLFAAASLAAYAYGLKRQAGFWHGIAGMLVGLSLVAHYHAVGLGVIYTIALYLPFYRAKWRGDYVIPYRHILFFVFGGILGAGIVLFLYILPNWGGVLEGRDWRGITNLIQFPVLYIQYLYVARQFLFEQLFTFAALALLLYKANLKDRALVWLFFLGPAMLAILARGGFPHYVQHVAPVFALMMGRGIDKFLDFFPLKYTANRLAIGLLVFVTLIGNSTPLFVLEEQRPLDLQDPLVSTWIKEHFPQQAIVVAPNWYYFFFYEDYQFYSNRSWRDASPSRKELYADDAANFWDEVNPDVVLVISADVSNLLTRELLIAEDYLLSRGYALYVIEDETTFSENPLPVRIYYRAESLILAVDAESGGE